MGIKIKRRMDHGSRIALQKYNRNEDLRNIRLQFNSPDSNVFAMVFENCLFIWKNEEFRQFLADYWEEAKKYDPFISFLAVWGVFTPPVGMDVRKRTRTTILTIQVMISIGLSIQLKCQRDPMPGGVVVIMTMIFSTIPLEIINLLWFRVVMKRSLLVEESQKTDSSCRRCCMWTRQYLGTTLGVILTLCIFSYSVVFFILAFAGIHPGCNLQEKNHIIRNILLYQFFLTPTFMSLPYWRETSFYVSLLGPAGPVVGGYLYIRKNGFHPPKKEPELEKPTAAVEETKDIEASTSTSASEPVKQEVVSKATRPTSEPVKQEVASKANRPLSEMIKQEVASKMDKPSSEAIKQEVALKLKQAGIK